MYSTSIVHLPDHTANKARAHLTLRGARQAQHVAPPSAKWAKHTEGLHGGSGVSEAMTSDDEGRNVHVIYYEFLQHNSLRTSSTRRRENGLNGLMENSSNETVCITVIYASLQGFITKTLNDKTKKRRNKEIIFYLEKKSKHKWVL